jgi:YVTN family beta-propeller protein
MVKSNVVKLMLVVSLLAGLAWAVAGGNYPVEKIPGTPAGIGRYIIEDIQMCEDMNTAIMVGVANSDDAHVYWYNLNTDSVDGYCDAGVLYGPRGNRGIAVNFQCTYAYLTNYPIDSVSVIDLMNSPRDGGECVMTEAQVSPKPTGIAVTYPDSGTVLVADSFSDVVTIMDAAGNILDEMEVGFGPNSVLASGKSWAIVTNRYDDTAYAIDLPRGAVYEIAAGLNRVPHTACIDPAGEYVYAVGFVGSSVDVIKVGSWNVVKRIPVGDSPRYCAMDSAGKFLYVSNTIDKTVSVISTASKSVVDTIEIVGPTEPAPIGAIAVSKDNRYLYVWWTGGRSGTDADFVIFKIDVGQLYN